MKLYKLSYKSSTILWLRTVENGVIKKTFKYFRFKHHYPELEGLKFAKTFMKSSEALFERQIV